MARAVGPGGNNSAFNAALAAASNPAGRPGGISSATPENTNLAYTQYLSSDPDAYQKAPNIYQWLPKPGTKEYDKLSVINTSIDAQTAEEYLEQTEALEARLAEMGLDKNDYSEYWYNPAQQTSEMYEDVSPPGAPAQIIDVPTSSTNYSRPRTVAAGWTQNADDSEKGTLTVVFRDGTPYNFYDVPRAEWLGFQASISKGRPYLNRANSVNKADGKLLKYAHGPADVSALSEEMRRMVYVDARAKQIYYRNAASAPKYYQQKTYYKDPSKVTKKDRAVRDAQGNLVLTKTGRAIIRKRVSTVGTEGRPLSRTGKAPHRAVNPHQNAGKNKAQKKR